MKDKFEVGDIITAYHKGWWEVIDTFDHKYNLGAGDIIVPQVRYKNLFSNRVYTCASAFCKHVTMESVQEMIKQDVAKYDKIIQYLKTKG